MYYIYGVVVVTSTVGKFITFTVLWLLQTRLEHLLHLRFRVITYTFRIIVLLHLRFRVITFMVDIYSIYSCLQFCYIYGSYTRGNVNVLLFLGKHFNT